MSVQEDRESMGILATGKRGILSHPNALDQAAPFAMPRRIAELKSPSD